MKIIKYELWSVANLVPEDEPVCKPIFYATKIMPWSEANEQIAKMEAYNGEYTVADDGKPEPEVEASAEDVLNVMLGVM